MLREVTREGWLALPAWVSRATVREFTGLNDRDVGVLVEAGRLRTLVVGTTGKRQRYNKWDVGRLCGFRE